MPASSTGNTGCSAVGRTPRAGRGRAVRRLLGRLPLPRPVSLGLATPFSQPARSATIGAAVAFGTIGVTFGVGLTMSLSDIQDGLNRRTPGAVVVRTVPPPGSGAPRVADPKAVAEKIRAQPGTRRFFSTGQTRVGVAGLTGATALIASGALAEAAGINGKAADV